VATCSSLDFIINIRVLFTTRKPPNDLTGDVATNVCRISIGMFRRDTDVLAAVILGASDRERVVGAWEGGNWFG
jgi:hypothetical protein